jgi:hypothetical protein
MKKKIISIEVLLLILLTTAFFFMSTIYAAEVQIAKVTNEEDKNIVKLMLITDDENGDIVGFRHDTFLPSGKLKVSDKEDLSLLDQDGILLKESGEHKVLIMKSENFAFHNGGNLELDTLYNGATGERRSYQIELVRNGDEWTLERGRRQVKRIHLKSKKVFLLGTVGISDVQTRGFKLKP